MQQQLQRSGIIIGLLSLGLLTGAALTAGPAQAVSGAGITFPDRAWNRQLPASTRFFVLTDWSSEAVLDKETGLVWEQAPQTTTATWSSARGACIGKTVGNRKGWRLPSIPELASLVDPQQANPALPLGHPFPSVQSANYWSASSDAENPAFAWVVFFDNGDVGGSVKTTSGQVWCVRGGMQADQY